MEGTNAHVSEHHGRLLIENAGPARVGSRFKGRSKILGRTLDWVVEVTEDEHPTKQAIKSVEGKIDFTGTYAMTPESGGTRLNYRLESGAGLGGVFGCVADALVNKAYARRTRANLPTLAEIPTEHGDSQEASG